MNLRSPAKINLGLNVLGRRDDGYHDLESIFIALDLYDDITIEPGPTLDVHCSPPVTNEITDNLVYRAADRYRTMIGREHEGAKITVTKRIPTGAGLGGGSSNAATLLRGLRELWGDHPKIMDLAASLGSDVPFFMNGPVAYVTGRGEHITPIDITLPWVVLLILPDIHISTVHAYSTLGITQRREPFGLDKLLSYVVEDHQILRDQFINDFERPIFTQHPVLSTIKTILVEQGAIYAAMSGSGSAMFGLFTDVDIATRAQAVFADHKTYICRPL